MKAGKIAKIVSIAGSDSGGGAGIQADIKAISAQGGYALSVVTGLTAQNTRIVADIHMAPTDFVVKQMETVWSDITIDAVKIGMLGHAAMVEAVGDALARLNHAPIILDPVCVAKSGDRLLALDAIQALRRRLIPMAALVTPNLAEVQQILGLQNMPGDIPAMIEAGQKMRLLGARAVLIKGGHLGKERADDVFIDATMCEILSSARIATKNTHGTGCSLSAAIAANLPKADNMFAAVQAGKQYITRAIGAGDQLDIGSGHGPVHHFVDLWR